MLEKPAQTVPVRTDNDVAIAGGLVTSQLACASVYPTTAIKFRHDGLITLVLRPTMATSLQAAACGKNRAAKQKGAFESCFAQGLDLSEFGSLKTSSSSSTSSASKLLNIKRIEKEQADCEERQEAQMEEVVRKRALHLKETKEKLPVSATKVWQANDSTTNVIFSSMIEMHRADENGALKRQQQHRKRPGSSMKGKSDTKSVRSKKKATKTFQKRFKNR